MSNDFILIFVFPPEKGRQVPKCKLPMMLILNFIERKRASSKAPAPPIVPPRIAVVDDFDVLVASTGAGMVELVGLGGFVEFDVLLSSTSSAVYLSHSVMF